uniref:Uncharacterized protein n=1 Tax=Amphimedon queenslandica TaxID=400682 RepID=A0A1X7SQY1_AMPQE
MDFKDLYQLVLIAIMSVVTLLHVKTLASIYGHMLVVFIKMKCKHVNVHVILALLIISHHLMLVMITIVNQDCHLVRTLLVYFILMIHCGMVNSVLD